MRFKFFSQLSLLIFIVILSLGGLFGGLTPSLAAEGEEETLFRRSFGITVNTPSVNSAEVARLTKFLGATWARFLVSSSGTNSDLEGQIAALQQKSIQPYLMVFNESAAIGAGGRCTRTSDWPIDLWHSPPANWNLWADFLRGLVRSYGFSATKPVKYWEISFEENAPGCPFGDNPQTYVNFLCRSARVIKNTDPAAKIVLGRLLDTEVDRHDNYLEKILSLGAADCFDVVSLGGPYGSGAYDHVDKYLRATKEKLAAAGVSKPIWMTEGEGPSDSDGDGVRDWLGDQQQETYVREFYNRALAGGAQKVFYNGLTNRRPNYPKKRFIQIGLVDFFEDNLLQRPLPKPAYCTLRQMARGKGCLAGDFNFDDKVDQEDYQIFRRGYNSTSGTIDLNHNGRVDVADYVLFTLSYGS